MQAPIQVGRITPRALLKAIAYPKVTVSDAELKAVNLLGHDFHPEWNYTIAPRAPQPAPADGSEPAAAAAA